MSRKRTRDFVDDDDDLNDESKYKTRLISDDELYDMKMSKERKRDSKQQESKREVEQEVKHDPIKRARIRELVESLLLEIKDEDSPEEWSIWAPRYEDEDESYDEDDDNDRDEERYQEAIEALNWVLSDIKQWWLNLYQEGLSPTSKELSNRIWNYGQDLIDEYGDDFSDTGATDTVVREQIIGSVHNYINKVRQIYSNPIKFMEDYNIVQ